MVERRGQDAQSVRQAVTLIDGGHAASFLLSSLR
jgi:hypothetical protein